MLTPLPLIFFMTAVLLARTFSHKLLLNGWRESLVAGSLITGLCFAAGTGLLSLFNAIDRPGIIIWWIVLILTSGIIVIVRRDKLCWKDRNTSPTPDPLNNTMLIAWLGLAALLFFLAVAVVPNSWDAMVYHMSRVAHWIHNRNVAYFPTPITRELWAMPLAEYVILHLQILSASDAWANSVQCFGWAGSCIGASLIAKMLGASRHGQIAAMIIAATIPMSILQTASTKNDLLTAFWLTGAVWALLKWQNQGQKPAHVLIAATAVALAMFTKGSSFLFLPPFLITACLLAPKNWKKISALIIGLLVGILFVSGFFHLRNRVDLGAWNPAPDAVLLQNETMNIPLFASNLIKHSAVHLQTPFQKINNVFSQAIHGAYNAFKVDFNDPRITHPLSEDSFLQAATAYNEYYAGNFLHFFLGLICCLVGIFWIKDSQKQLRLYIFALILAYCFFVIYMRWQPWISRLQLPLFILGAPIIACAIERVTTNRRVLTSIVLILLIATAPWILKNRNRPLIGKTTVFSTPREEQYFLDRPYMFAPFKAITGIIQNTPCRKVGIILNDGGWEYPYWAFLKDDRNPIDIRHIDVTNASRRYEDPSWMPCAIILDSSAEDPRIKIPEARDEISFRGRTFVRQLFKKPLSVYTYSDPSVKIRP
ncbi:MAG: glycosyltransferase family 39 protein [Candidatus Omnitrophica bacterium]|nr:glycosyltransferase family 39 protein [Candidatus Omnitrophota bacterium]